MGVKNAAITGANEIIPTITSVSEPIVIKPSVKRLPIPHLLPNNLSIAPKQKNPMTMYTMISLIPIFYLLLSSSEIATIFYHIRVHYIYNCNLFILVQYNKYIWLKFNVSSITHSTRER